MTTQNDTALDTASAQEILLVEEATRALDVRRDAGLDGLVGSLDSVIITTETEHLVPATYELLRYTGLSCKEAFFDADSQSYVLSVPGSASLIVRSRSTGPNPFASINKARLTGPLPDTRLETFVFTTPDIGEYVAIQKARGVKFLTPEPQVSEYFSTIQTIPSPYTGNSIGFIEWQDEMRTYAPTGSTSVSPDISKPAYRHLNTIGGLDHAATRVKAQDRTAAILEFISLTSYHYDFGVHVKSQNSITSVARRNKEDFAMVFTSGITPYTSDEASGPTEKFIKDFGTRVHHMAFRTEKIEETVAALKKDGMEFLLELVGSETEGLMQIFSEPSHHTLMVNEYIHRFGGFDGFFTRSNVEKLTEATGKQ
ncbi:MAG: hypothetical protein Q7T80_06000 [Methanoregula sp.]|nr:hypothetical protein [Methanoregula sp.]